MLKETNEFKNFKDSDEKTFIIKLIDVQYIDLSS